MFKQTVIELKNNVVQHFKFALQLQKAFVEVFYKLYITQEKMVM